MAAMLVGSTAAGVWHAIGNLINAHTNAFVLLDEPIRWQDRIEEHGELAFNVSGITLGEMQDFASICAGVMKLESGGVVARNGSLAEIMKMVIDLHSSLPCVKIQNLTLTQS